MEYWFFYTASESDNAELSTLGLLPFISPQTPQTHARQASPVKMAQPVLITMAITSVAASLATKGKTVTKVSHLVFHFS